MEPPPPPLFIKEGGNARPFPRCIGTGGQAAPSPCTGRVGVGGSLLLFAVDNAHFVRVLDKGGVPEKWVFWKERPIHSRPISRLAQTWRSGAA